MEITNGNENIVIERLEVMIIFVPVYHIFPLQTKIGLC